jgi:hypothetical protein
MQTGQSIVDRGQAAGQTCGGAQFGQGQIGMLLEQSLKLLPMVWQNLRLPPCPMMEGCDIAQSPPLLQQFLDQPQRDAEPLRHSGACPAGTVVSGENALTDLKADCLHGTSLSPGGMNGYTII